MPETKNKTKVEVFGYRDSEAMYHFNRSEVVGADYVILSAQRLVAEAIENDGQEISIIIKEMKEH